MKYLKSSNGHHWFQYEGNPWFEYDEQVLIAWVVVGNKTLCVSLDDFEGDWLRFEGKDYKDQTTVEGMQKFLIKNRSTIELWLPHALDSAAKKKAEREAEQKAKEDKYNAKLAKDRSIPLYRSVKLKKRKHEIIIVTQPYEAGIYILVCDSKLSSPIQMMGINHRSANRRIDKIIQFFAGYKITSRKETVTYPLH